MRIDEIQKVVNQLNSNCVVDLLKQHGIKVAYCEALNKRKMDATLSDNVILIKTDLTAEHEEFILFHELGHYLLHFEKNRAFSFYLYRYKNRLENEANIFAFLCLLKEEELEDVNLIDFAIRKGVPSQIAVRVVESLQQTSFQ